jgi:integrase
MATVYQKRGAWYVGFRGATGRRICRATKAESKTEAKRIAAELERQAERQRFGLEALPTDNSRTLADLCRWWLAGWCPVASFASETYRLTRHVLEKPIGALPLRQVTAAALDDHFRRLHEEGLSGASCNHLRAILRTVVGRARKQGEWSGENAVALTTPLPTERHAPETLAPAEVERLLPFVNSDWRGYLATAALLGMRPGEPGLLRKSDVNVEALTLTVRASKTGLADVLPIPAALWPYVEAGLRTRGAYLFGNADGSRRHPTTEALRVLRSAMRRAGLVEGYDHTCRRCKARALRATPPSDKFHVERQADAAPRQCPTCKAKLWPVAIPRKVTVYGLRHSMATALLRSGAGLHTAQRVLRHASPNTTAKHYAHLVAEDLRGALNGLGRAVPVPSAPAEKAVAAAAGGSEIGPDATRLLPDPKRSPPESGDVDGKRCRNNVLRSERRRNRTFNLWIKSPLLCQLS